MSTRDTTPLRARGSSNISEVRRQFPSLDGNARNRTDKIRGQSVDISNFSTPSYPTGGSFSAQKKKGPFRIMEGGYSFLFKIEIYSEQFVPMFKKVNMEVSQQNAKLAAHTFDNAVFLQRSKNSNENLTYGILDPKRVKFRK